MTFQLSRFFQLTKIEILQNFIKSILIISLIYFGISLLGILPYMFNGHRVTADIHSSWLTVTIIGGIIVGSASFGEITKRHSRINYLNLPASATEKVLSKAVVNIILFPIAMFVLFLVVKGLFSGLANITAGGIGIGDQFELSTWNMMSVILLVTSLFFYGSIRFNNYAFPLTIAWVILFVLAIAAISFLVALMIFPELREAVAGNPQAIESMNMPSIEHHWVITMFKYLFYIAPIIFIVLSIICLTEKEG